MITTYSEFQDSQLPALQLLQKMGWQYISPEDTVNERDGFYSGVLLENILSEQLQKINNFEYKGDAYIFSRGNIQGAINKKVDKTPLSKLENGSYNHLIPLIYYRIYVLIENFLFTSSIGIS